MRPPLSDGAPLGARLVAFTSALRRHGVAVGTSDLVDAAAIAETLGLDERGRLREGFAAALLRRSEQRQLFDELFDLFFPAAVGSRTTLTPDTNLHSGADSDAPPPQSDDPTPPIAPRSDAASERERAQQLLDDLAQALAHNDERALDALAAAVVEEFGALHRPGENGFSARQALETFQPNLAIARAAEVMRDGPDAGGSGGGTSGGSSGGAGGAGANSHATHDHSAADGWQAERFTQRFDRDDARTRVAAFRRRVETESRRRNAEIRGVTSQAEYAVTTPLEQRAFGQTYSVDAAEMRRVVDPLARKLAARMEARRRRATHGRIDVRRTLRASMSTGGVPIEPVYARRHRGRPELVILADMSSSVSGFSRFTILLMQAMQAQFGRVRVYGFVNAVDDLTNTVHAVGRDGDLIAALQGNTRMTRGHRNSDYGTVFEQFAAEHLGALTPRSTLLILGDARTNNTNPRYEALTRIVAQAAHAAWLNPESESQWGQGDSVAPQYAEIIDMHECRTITDLREFVTRVL